MNLSALSQLADNIVGMDYSQSMVVRAIRQVVEEEIANIELFVGDVSNTPLQSDRFDKVLCVSVLQYMDEESSINALKKFVRISREGGILVLHIKKTFHTS